MELLKLLSANEVVAQVLNFLLLLFLLRVFFWKRILKLLDERRARIASEFQKIEDCKKHTEALKSEYEIKLTSIEDTAKIKTQEAVDKGIMAAGQIIKKAHDDAENIIESAKRDIKHEVTKAKEGLKEQIIDLTLQAARELIQDKFTPEDDRKLVGEFLKEIDKTK